MAKTYLDCAVIYAKRRDKKANDWKPISHNQKLRYNPERDCYEHKHHNTITVRVFADDTYEIDTDGWDTVTTRSKIREFVPISTCCRPTPAFKAGKYLRWDGKKYTPFYDGIMVNRFGEPLDPEPCEMLRARPGVFAEFNELAKKVRAAVAVRMFVGEFDDVDNVPVPDDDEAFNLMREVAARSEGLFKEFIPAAEVMPLFAQRPLMSFGKERGRFGNSYDDETSPAKTRLNSNINAAKRAWMKDKTTKELYETIKRSFT